MNPHACSQSHLNGIIFASSIEQAKKVAKVAQLLPPRCFCQEVISSKGVCLGWKNGKLQPLQQRRSIARYLRRYWREQGVLNVETEQYFSERYEKISCVILNGEEYRIGDHVVTRVDGEENNALHMLDPQATWKAKSTLLFIHEDHGDHRLFFHAKWFRQV